jgi:ferric-dicitrate binding protein FerR (iron transport regulator)
VTTSNASSKARAWFAGVAVAVLAVAAVAVVTLRMHAARTPHALWLADGTQAFFLTGTKVEPAKSYPDPREIKVDGDAFIRTPAASSPLIVRTRLLVLTVSGDSAFRVTGYSKDTGEQVEVLQGHIQAHKSYPSSYSEPDILGNGEMTMINRTIDLMEKETFDPAELRMWSDALTASVTASRSVADQAH